MILRWSVLIVVTLCLSGCTSNYPLKSVDYTDLFCDGNSKVWIVNKAIVKKVNVAPFDLVNKEVMVFHESGTLDFILFKRFGREEPKKGRYYLDSDKRIMSIVFKNEEWVFKLSVLEEDRVVMRPLKKGKAPFTLELIPLPEL